MNDCIVDIWGKVNEWEEKRSVGTNCRSQDSRRSIPLEVLNDFCGHCGDATLPRRLTNDTIRHRPRASSYNLIYARVLVWMHHGPAGDVTERDSGGSWNARFASIALSIAFDSDRGIPKPSILKARWEAIVIRLRIFQKRMILLQMRFRRIDIGGTNGY